MLVPRNLIGMMKSCFIESDESFVGFDRFHNPMVIDGIR